MSETTHQTYSEREDQTPTVSAYRKWDAHRRSTYTVGVSWGILYKKESQKFGCLLCVFEVTLSLCKKRKQR
jgi:hypothetical protein